MITIYCDGSCPKPNGVGGWAYVIIIPRLPEVFESGWSPLATNQTMELYAALRALRTVRGLQIRNEPLEIVSDSQYLVKGMMEWGEGWKANNYEGIKNEDLWRRLHRHQVKCRALTFRWVKGHAGSTWNEECDKMAGRAQRKGVETLANERKQS